MRHGTIRNKRQEDTFGPEEQLVDMEGRVVYRGPLFASSVTVCEHYCALCRRWVFARGLLGAIEWDAEHRHGEGLDTEPLPEGGA